MRQNQSGVWDGRTAKAERLTASSFTTLICLRSSQIMVFPKDFVWGAAAAAYQIEGAYNADGRGLSVWDDFAHRPGKTYNGHTGDVACDHYHRYPEDVTLMYEIGLAAYRLSLSWSRILPQGIGSVNEKGLAFYDRLIDELLANNIEPYVTLFHWDLPLALYQRGGWLNRDSSDWFASYAEAVARVLGDRVRFWMTMNEPSVFTVLGHLFGIHAPGDQRSPAEGFRIAHHVLMAHGKASQALRAAHPGSQISMAGNGRIGIPQTRSQSDIDAARKYTFDTTNPELWQLNWWTDPVMFGSYPAEGLKTVEAILPAGFEKDMPVIHQPYDYFGLNVYWGDYVSADANGGCVPTPKYAGSPITAFHWDITPEVLYWGPIFLYERYKLPIVITENGLSNSDWVSLDGRVHDPQRIDYTQRHLLQLSQAHQDGAAIAGYFHWSIMDNFEWAEGMKHRFGLIHVDYQTQKRTLKESAYWYRDVIRSNGGSLSGSMAEPGV
jgi:beta-glucosidase